MSPALAGGFLTTAPPREALNLYFYSHYMPSQLFICMLLFSLKLGLNICVLFIFLGTVPSSKVNAEPVSELRRLWQWGACLSISQMISSPHCSVILADRDTTEGTALCLTFGNCWGEGQLAPLGEGSKENSRTKRNSPLSGYQKYPFTIPPGNSILVLHGFLFLMSGFLEA